MKITKLIKQIRLIIEKSPPGDATAYKLIELLNKLIIAELSKLSEDEDIIEVAKLQKSYSIVNSIKRSCYAEY